MSSASRTGEKQAEVQLTDQMTDHTGLQAPLNLPSAEVSPPPNDLTLVLFVCLLSFNRNRPEC